MHIYGPLYIFRDLFQGFTVPSPLMCESSEVVRAFIQQKSFTEYVIGPKRNGGQPFKKRKIPNNLIIMEWSQATDIRASITFINSGEIISWGKLTCRATFTWVSHADSRFRGMRPFPVMLDESCDILEAFTFCLRNKFTVMPPCLTDIQRNPHGFKSAFRVRTHLSIV